MIIESAFYRLPELWVKDPNELSAELDVAADFKSVISKILKANHIDTKPSLDKQYPINKTSGPGPKLKADLYVKIPFPLPPSSWYSQYVIQGETWIEAKYFRQGSNQTSFALGKKDLVKIARDLLRLCVLVKESQGGIRDKSRYFCAVFYAKANNESGTAYSPLVCKSEPPPWLVPLLSPGVHDSTILSFKEPTELPAPLELTLKTITYTFAPLPTVHQSRWLYWGYLVRIFGFALHFVSSNDTLEELDLLYEPHGYWSPKQVEAQQKIGDMLIRAKLVQSG